jgi:hypothetical protein
MDADQQRAVDAILKHDLDSSAAELVYYFVHELGVLEREAWQIVIRERKEYVAAQQKNTHAVGGALRRLA